MRHVSVLIALVLLLSCQSGATGQQAAMMAAPPPPNIAFDWGEYTVSVGANKTAKQYLDAITALTNVMNPAEKDDILLATGELDDHLFAGHTEAQSWARVMLAYRFATRDMFTACKAELFRFARNKAAPGTWHAFKREPHGETINQLILKIREKNKDAPGFRPKPNDPTIDDVNTSLTNRNAKPHNEHEFAESWNRVLLAWYLAETAADDDAQWQRVKDELDHAE